MTKALLLILPLLLSAACQETNANNPETFNQTYGSVFARECGRACSGRMAMSEWIQGQAIIATCRCTFSDAGYLVDAGAIPAEALP